MYTLMVGNPNGGYEAVETFGSHLDAVEYAKEWYSRSDWFVLDPNNLSR